MLLKQGLGEKVRSVQQSFFKIFDGLPKRGARAPGYPFQVLARSSLWAFHYYPWPKVIYKVTPLLIVLFYQKQQIVFTFTT
jgi:hypothetical protein